MAKHRTHSIEFKRQVAQDFIAGETLHGLAKRHDISRNLIRIWVKSLRLGHLMRMPARLIFFRSTKQRSRHSNAWSAGRPSKSSSKGGAEKRTTAEKREYIRLHRPYGISVAEGCRLMGLPRSTYYDAPPVKTDDAEIVTNITAICDEFEAYGYRRVGAELRHQGMVVNSKKIRRLMREHDSAQAPTAVCGHDRQRPR